MCVKCVCVALCVYVCGIMCVWHICVCDVCMACVRV